MNINLETMLAWGEPKRVQTSQGAKILRKAKPTDEFSNLYRTNRQALKDAGIGWSEWPKGSGNWEVCWWQPIPKSELEQQAKNIEQSAATDAEIVIPAPDGLTYMGFQKAGVRYCAEKYRKQDSGVLIGDEMGLGKTIQAIGVINLDPTIQRVLIIVPNSLKWNWFRELNKWLVRKFSIGVAEGKTFPSTDIVIINYDILHNFEKSLSYYWDLLVIDEAHYLCNRSARRTKCVMGFKPRKNEQAKAQQKAADLEKAGRTVEAQVELRKAAGKAPLNARRKLVMTGTPMVNRPADLFTLISFADPGRWDNEFKFKMRYCGGTRNGFGWDFSGSSNLEELQRELRASCMIRRLKKDVLKDMPLKLRRVVELQPDAEAQEAIDAENECQSARQLREGMERLQCQIDLASASEDKEAYNAAIRAMDDFCKAKFTEMAAERHRVGVAKVPMVIEYLKRILEEDPGHKAVIFAHHIDVIDALRAQWPNASVVVGGVEASERMRQVDRFQNDPSVPWFIGGLRAAAEGITLTAASHVIFAEFDWTPGKMSQAEDRCHRIGQHDNVLAEHLVLAGSMDVRMANTLIEKQEIIDRALDDKTNLAVEEPEETVTSLELQPGQERKAPQTANGKARSATWEQIGRIAETITEEQIGAIHMGLRMLAGMDQDHAAVINDMGFNKMDGGIGHSLAEQKALTKRQAALGLRLVIKYKRQLGEDLVATAKGTKNDN